MISAYKKGLYTRMNSKQKICGTLFLILDKLEIQYHISAIHRQILNYTYPIVFAFCRNIYFPLSNEIMIQISLQFINDMDLYRYPIPNF